MTIVIGFLAIIGAIALLLVLFVAFAVRSSPETRQTAVPSTGENDRRAYEQRLQLEAEQRAQLNKEFERENQLKKDRQLDVIYDPPFSGEKFRDIARSALYSGDFYIFEQLIKAYQQHCPAKAVEKMALESIYDNPRRGPWALRLLRLLSPGKPIDPALAGIVINQCLGFEIPLNDLRTIVSEAPEVVPLIEPKLVSQCYLVKSVEHARLLVEHGVSGENPLEAFIYVSPVFGIDGEESPIFWHYPNADQDGLPVIKFLFAGRN